MTSHAGSLKEKGEYSTNDIPSSRCSFCLLVVTRTKAKEGVVVTMVELSNNEVVGRRDTENGNNLRARRETKTAARALLLLYDKD